MMSELSKLARDTANRNRAARWPEDLDSAEDILEELADEIERLQAIIDKLPKTADGVPVVPGMRLWSSYNNGRDVTGFSTCDGRLVEIIFKDGFDRCTWAHYSTREAVQKAREA